MKKFQEFALILIVALIFLAVAGLVIKDYGINWDEPYHFMRGQAYLHYFLTGQKDYKSLEPYPTLNPQCPSQLLVIGECDVSPHGAWDVVNSQKKAGIYGDEIEKKYASNYWRSIFQHDTYTYSDFVANDVGHPPLTDILTSVGNYLLYQRLHILGDVESYHFVEVAISALLVGAVFYFVRRKFGIFAGLVAAFSLGAYPLFFAESHFNIKDPAIASWIGLTMIFFYLGITKLNWKLILISAIFAGVGVGTKFNMFFTAFIVGPWLLFYIVLKFKEYQKDFKARKFRKYLPILLSLVLYLPIAFGVFYAFWPFLWGDPLGVLSNVVQYYKSVGVGTPAEMTAYIFHGWNLYPIYWIIVTTPLPILILSTLGVFFSLRKVLSKKHLYFFILLWFAVPILHASWPNAGLYGGVRQIMEYVPAMAILSGIGAYWLIKIFRGKYMYMIIIASLIFVSWEMIRIHPNENVYFNQLVGGLPGAAKLNIPYWGNTYGNVYAQGVKWLNKNAEPNAKLGLPLATQANISRSELRSDIDFWNGHWSGTNRAGEYEIEMYLANWSIRGEYSFTYYDTYLNPVYEAKVDGVTLLKVWKNDLAHTKPGYEKESNYSLDSVHVNKSQMTIDMGKQIQLTKVLINHNTLGCTPLKDGYISTSLDGTSWSREVDPINTAQVPITTKMLTDKTFIFLFPAKLARYIQIDTITPGSCIFSHPQFTISGLSK